MLRYTPLTNTLKKMTTYYIPNRSFPRRPLKKNGEEQKAYEWAQVQGVPCKIIKKEEASLVLHSFLSDSDQNFRVSNAELSEQFTQAKLEGEYIVGVSYPEGRLHISEFDKRKEASDLIASALKVICDESLRDKLKQTDKTQGCTHTATIDEFLKLKSGELKLKPTENFGDPIFNRSKRWAPPIDMDHETFQKTAGFPAPLGVRPKDFCLPSGVLAGVRELLVQMARFDKTPAEIRKFVSELPGMTIPEGIHCCKWCGEKVDADKCTSKYKSVTNYIELCHRDPNAMFTPENVYWGHGDCNRRQGGYTEYDRIEDVVRLAKQDPAYRAELLRQLGL